MKLCPECYLEFEDNLTSCPNDGITLASIEPDPLIGTKLSDRYEILSVIGRGGMGVVYKARHDTLDRLVAVKMLHSHLVTDAEALKRFHREAKAVSRVKNPHSVTLYDFGLTPTGQPFIVMDYIDGTGLKRIIKEEGPLPLERVGHIFEQVVEALNCAHAEGVVHRDLKPENIMLTRRANDPEWVEVVDFGISKLKGKDNNTTYNITRVGDVCGSPPYMSPEQCLGSMPVDSRSDVYACGVVLYEALAGRLPFKAKSAIEMIDCHLYANPTPLKAANPALSCCEALSALLNKALAKEPERRQQSMQEFGDELKQAIARDSVKLKLFSSQSQMQQGANQYDEQYGASSGSRNSAIEALAINGSGRAKTTDGLPAIPGLAPMSFLGKIANALLSLLGRGGLQSADKAGYVFDKCPFCGAPVKTRVKFCLNCGRNLASSQELSKLRMIQGVFALPKNKNQDSRGETPEFSNKARAVSNGADLFFGIPRRVFIFNLALLMALFWMYFSQNPYQLHQLNRNLNNTFSGKKAQKKTQRSRFVSSSKHRYGALSGKYNNAR